ncbi:MAG: hypothetical protein NZ853_03690 [Leptospiraceae bacterium]|nr:hypothetical protein [Leptospiraceae bacterium]MDW7975277.1 hypothetical protein [Leptospiraceae bacterium]
MKIYQWEKKYSEFFLIVLIIIFVFIVLADSYAFIGDTFVKVLQSYSLIQNRFLSEDLYYPFRVYDPDYQYFYLKVPMFLNLEDKKLGAFPVFYSILIAPIVWLEPYALPFFTLTINLISYWILKHYWNLSKFMLVFFIFGTFLFLNSVDGSESSLLILFQLVGLTFLFKTNKETLHTLLGIFFLSLGMWLRIEMFIFMGILILFWFLVFWEELKHDLKEQKKFLQILVFSGIFVSIYFLFHYFHYGHIFGPRFVLNIKLEDYSLIRQLRFMLSLSFFGDKFFKLGFFGYIPLFLLTIFFAFKRLDILDKKDKVLFFTGLTAVFVLGFLAPNDGLVNLGPRYLILGIVPFLVITNKLWELKVIFKRVFMVFAFYSFLITTLYFFLSREYLKNFKHFNEIIATQRGDFYITIHGFDVVSAGLLVLRSPLILVENPEDYSLMEKIKAFLDSDQTLIFYYSSYSESQNRDKIQKIISFLGKYFILTHQMKIDIKQGEFYFTFYHFRKK